MRGRRYLTRRVSLVGVLALVGLTAMPGGRGAVAAEGEAHPASRWVSSDAVIYLEVMRPSTLLDRARDDRVRALVDALPGFKKRLETDGVRKLFDVVRLVAGKLDRPWDEALRDLTGGGAVFAVEADDKEGATPRAFLIVTPTDPELPGKATRVLIELARQDAEANGRPDPVKSAEYRNVTGYAIGTKAAYAVVEGKLVIGDRAETVKTIVDRALDGPPKRGTVEGLKEWKAGRADVAHDALAWGLARLDRLRKVDPKRFKLGEKADTGATLLFGGWLETAREAPWVSASLTWTDSKLAAGLTTPAPADMEKREAIRGYLPPAGSGAPGLIAPPGTILSASLWRDLATVWDARADLIRPEDVQNLAKLDGFAGQFFGGRDFGSGVLGSTTPDWRLVVALQDFDRLRPTPDVKLPAFALVFGTKPGDEEFVQRLRVAFQSFIGLVNIGSAQKKAPPLELLSEPCEGLTISTTRYMPQGNDAGEKGAKPAVPTRYNLSPSAVQVGDYFVLSSSLGLARDLVKAIKSGEGRGKVEDGTLVAEADGAALARLVGLNRDRLVMQNILQKGNDQARAEGEIDLLASLLRYLGRARLSVKDGAERFRVGLSFELGR